jgi:DNA-binding CsgD family transcriptional regulator
MRTGSGKGAIVVELKRRDLTALLELAARIHAINDPGRFSQDILAPLLELVPSDSITYNEIDTRRGKTIWTVDPIDALDETDPAAFVRYVPQHPVVSYSRRTGDGRAHTISEFLDRSRFHRTDLYATFFRVARVEHQLAITISYAPSTIVGVALNRSSRDFSSRDRTVLNVARQQLMAGYQAASRAQEAAHMLAALDEALADQRRGVLTVRPDGHLIAASPTAERMLRGELGIRLEPGQRLPRRLADLAGSAPARARPLVIKGLTNRLYLRVLPAPEADQRIIVVDARSDCEPVPLETVGLTRRQCEVLDLLARGRTNQEIARELGMSVRTVHKHLEHLYPKLGVHDRTAAATTWLSRHNPPPAN